MSAVSMRSSGIRPRVVPGRENLGWPTKPIGSAASTISQPAALDGLSDHMLKDMGIARSEIQALVYSRSVDQRGGAMNDNAG